MRKSIEECQNAARDDFLVGDFAPLDVVLSTIGNHQRFDLRIGCPSAAIASVVFKAARNDEGPVYGNSAGNESVRR